MACILDISKFAPTKIKTTRLSQNTPGLTVRWLTPYFFFIVTFGMIFVRRAGRSIGACIVQDGLDSTRIPAGRYQAFSENTLLDFNRLRVAISRLTVYRR